MDGFDDCKDRSDESIDANPSGAGKMSPLFLVGKIKNNMYIISSTIRQRKGKIYSQYPCHQNSAHVFPQVGGLYHLTCID